MFDAIVARPSMVIVSTGNDARYRVGARMLVVTPGVRKFPWEFLAGEP